MATPQTNTKQKTKYRKTYDKPAQKNIAPQKEAPQEQAAPVQQTQSQPAPAQGETINDTLNLAEAAGVTPEQQKEKKKNPFEISREVQEEFVNNLAQNMLSLAEKAGKWKKGWRDSDQAAGLPFCPTTGKEYSGSNMAALLITSMIKGYDDDRWVTFNQMESIRQANPDFKMCIRKGEKGTKLLRPEKISFTVEEDGRWHYLSKQELKNIEEMKARGEETPEVNERMVFYPFTVFNANQIDGFPPKQRVAPALSNIERNELIENFIASSGVQVEHYDGGPCFVHDADVVKMKFPDQFVSTEEYNAAKLHEFFHATGHSSRENRLKPNSDVKAYAFEEMRAEMFSMLVGAHLNLPMPKENSAAYIKHWNQQFSGGDAREVFKATAEAAKGLVLLHQFQRGEKPTPNWFPAKEEWPALVQMQRTRDEIAGVKFKDPAEDKPSVPGEKIPREEPANYEQAVVNFKDASEPMAQMRAILQNPQFMEMAMKAAPDKMHDLASLLSSTAFAMSMEADEKQKSLAEPAPQTTTPMRMR